MGELMDIKGIREKALLTQKEFAKELGVSIGIVQRWEKNENQPSLRYKRRLIQFCKENGIEF